MNEFNAGRAVEIWEEGGGPMSLTTWARACIGDGAVFSEEFRAKAMLSRARKRLADYAREENEVGLPRFGETTRTDDAGEAIYDQPEFWDRDDALFNIRKRIDNRDAAHIKLVKMVEWFEDRFGGPCPYRPQVDRLPGLEYGDDTAPWND